MKKALVALMAAAVMAVPATAYADTTVGGQSAHAGPCDITLVSVTVNPSTGQVSFNIGGADCDLSIVYMLLAGLTCDAVTYDPSTGDIYVNTHGCPKDQ